MSSIYNRLVEKVDKNIKSFAVLLDPDKLDNVSLENIIRLSKESNVDYFFLGGSLLSKYNIPEIELLNININSADSINQLKNMDLDAINVFMYDFNFNN